jgi:hypothetical protein
MPSCAKDAHRCRCPGAEAPVTSDAPVRDRIPAPATLDDDAADAAAPAAVPAGTRSRSRHPALRRTRAIIRVNMLGVDEHIQRPSKTGAQDPPITGMVDLTTDEEGDRLFGSKRGVPSCSVGAGFGCG